ncbi:solute carrier family 13 member 2-like [Haemaphysalis longicornis]
MEIRMVSLADENRLKEMGHNIDRQAQSSSPREKATPKKAKSPQPRNAAFSSGVASPSSGGMSPSGTAPSSAVGEKGKPGSLKQRATVKAIAAQRALARTLSFGKPAQMTSRRFAFIVAIPVLALVVPLCAPTKVGWCIYCMMVMYSYWATQALPIAVTSLLPVVIFPLTGIMSVDDTTSSYFDNAGITLFCALVASTAVEVSRLDQRIALNVTRVIGVEYGRLLLAVMLCTAFLSMWIPNTTVAAIVCPVVVAILKNLKECADAAEENRRGVAANVVFMTEETRLTDSRFVRLKKLMLLALAYSSSIGGTGSIIGTTANLILLEQVENGRAMTIAPETEERIMKDIQKRCDDLGHIRFSESVVTFLLTLMALLMFTQKPLFMQGWSEALPHSNMIIP